MPDLATMFAEEPDFKLSQYTRLSENSNEWQEEIFKLLHEKLPQKLGLRVKIVFQKIDEQTGYGVGSVIAQDPESKKQINVPIIIRAFHLAPLDVMISGDKAMPFTQENLKEALFNAAVFTGTAPGGRKPDDVFYDDSLYQQTFPPIYGKYMYSHDYRVMNAISGTLGADDIAAFRGHLDAEPRTIRQLVKNGAAEVINGITTEPAAEEKQSVKDVKTLFTIKKNAPNRYCILANSESVFDPMTITANRGEVTELLSRLSGYSKAGMHTINDVDKNGESTVKLPAKPYEQAQAAGKLGKGGVPYLFDPKADAGAVQELTKFDRVGVKDKAGVFARGVLLPNIVDFNGKKTGMKIFVGQGISSLQSRIAGVVLKDGNDQPAGSARLPFGHPSVGKYGFFAYETEAGAVGTVPVEIKGVTVYAGTTGVRVITYDRKVLNLVFAPGVNAIGKTPAIPMLGPLTSSKEDNFYVPDTFKFVEMRNLRHVAEDRAEFVKQANADVLDSNPLRIIALNDGYVFKGPSEKYASAFDMQSLAHHEAKFLLASWGASPAQADQFLKAAHVQVRTEVHGLSWPALPEVAYAGQVKQAGVLKTACDAVKARAWTLTKIAAGIKDSETVDKALALNFVNPGNVKRFVGAVPQYKEVISSLAKLLLASRLGMEDVPEEEVVTAMGAMMDVVRGLEKLKLLDKSDEAPRG